MAISAPAVPGAAEAVRQAGRKDVNVIGLSLPNINKPYVHDGVVQTVVLWNTTRSRLPDRPRRRAHRARPSRGRSLNDSTAVAWDRSRSAAAEIILGPPLKFTKANIDQFDF